MALSKDRLFQALLALGALWICHFPTFVFSQAPFYQGKTVTIIQGREPGALGDNRAGAFIPFLWKYIPGNPTIVSEFMSGGGGRKATNNMYASVRPDGLTIGNVGAGLVANAVLREPGVQYDLDKLIYLGSPNSATHYVFLTRRELGLNILEKLQGKPMRLVVGTSAGGAEDEWARFLAPHLGRNIPGSPDSEIKREQGRIESLARFVWNTIST